MAASVSAAAWAEPVYEARAEFAAAAYAGARAAGSMCECDSGEREEAAVVVVFVVFAVVLAIIRNVIVLV